MKFSFKLVVFFFVMNLTGCATFPGEVLPIVEEFPVTTEKPSINLSVTFRQYMNGQPLNIAVKTVEKDLMERALKRFNKSGMYSTVSSDDPNADISVKFDVVDEGSGSMGMAFLTGLTLYIVPSSATDLFKVSAKIRNNKTGGEGVIEIEDFVTMWQQIFLLPVLPFKLLPVVVGDVQDNMIDTLAIKIHKLALSGDLVIPSIGSEKGDTLNRMTILKDAFDRKLISGDEYKAKKQELLKGL